MMMWPLKNKLSHTFPDSPVADSIDAKGTFTATCVKVGAPKKHTNEHMH